MSLKTRLTDLESRTAGVDPESAWIQGLTDEELNALLGKHLNRVEEAGDRVLTERGYIVPEGTEDRDLLLQVAEILNRGLARMEKAQTGMDEP